MGGARIKRINLGDAYLLVTAVPHLGSSFSTIALRYIEYIESVVMYVCILLDRPARMEEFYISPVAGHYLLCKSNCIQIPAILNHPP